MILHAVFAFTAEFVGHRQRTSRVGVFSARASVDIREASLAELPVAFRWRRSDSFDLPEGPEGRHEVRFDGERLWEPYETVRHGGIGEPSALVRRDARWVDGRLDHRAMHGDHDPRGDDPLDLGVTGHAGRGRAPFIDEDPGIRTVRASNLDARYAEVQDAARRLLIADGRLFREAREPSYRLSRRHDGESGWTFMPEIVVRSGRADAGALWRLDEAGQMAAEHPMAPGYEEALAEVLVPEAVRLPLPEWALARAARDVTFWLEGDRHTGADAGAPMRELHAAVRSASEAEEAGRPIDAPALAESLAAARPLLELVEGTEGVRARAAVDKALARYDARCLDAGLGGLSP